MGITNHYQRRFLHNFDFLEEKSMQATEYKFERFSDPHFPIYLSAQSGRKTLVKIHYHSSVEIIQITDGRVELFAGGTRRECEKGDLVFIPPSAVHEMTSLTEDAAIRGVVYELPLADIAGLQQRFSALFAHSQRAQYIIGAKEDGHAELCGCIDLIHRYYHDHTIPGKMRITAALLQMEAALIQHFALEETAADSRYQKLAPVLAYLGVHYAEKIRISDLSRLIHVCDDRLIRLFREVTGETPVAYLANLRIEACLRLLAGTDDPLSAIAEKTGFGSDTYMTRVFKQKLGTTPGKYRKR